MNQEQSFILSDGRRLGYQCFGDPNGSALIFCHGTPGSRLAFSEGDLLAQVQNIRLIVSERPGYGISDLKPDRMLLDWARDIEELADHLEIDRFTVAGESGGGPHALAVAAGIPDRVEKCMVFGSPSPAGFKGATKGMAIGNKVGMLLNRYVPSISEAMVKNFAAGFLKDPDRVMKALAKQLPPSDRHIMESDYFRVAMIRDYTEAYKQGSEGHAIDSRLALTSDDWGFSLKSISIPVYLWHGEEDTLVSKNMASYLAKEIPRCTPYYIPDGGHFLLDRKDIIEQIDSLMNVSV